MILINGTMLTVEDLPFADVMDYILESNDQIFGFKLKTTAKSSNCVGIYINENSKSKFTLGSDIEDKVYYFSDDYHLVKLLESGGKELEVEDLVAEEPVSELELDFEESKVERLPEATLTTVVSTIEDESLVMEEADFSMQDQVLSIPEVGVDVDSLRQQLENYKMVNEQLKGNIQDLKSGFDEMLKAQESTLIDMKKEYESMIIELEEKVSSSGLSPEVKSFAKFSAYSKNYKALLREGYSDNDLSGLNLDRNKFFIFACGANDSLYTLLNDVKSLMENGKDLLVVDFTNEYFLKGMFDISSTEESSMYLRNLDIPVESLVHKLGDVLFIPTAYYNDIALLSLDWLSILSRLAPLAQNRRVIFLFNSLNSFAVRYSVSKLATIGKLFIFAQSNPVVLVSLLADIAFIPEGRFRIVLMKYIKTAESIAKHISSKHSVSAFSGSIDWGNPKLGIV